MTLTVLTNDLRRALQTMKAVAEERDGESQEIHEEDDWTSADEDEHEDNDEADVDEEDVSGAVRKIRVRSRQPRLADSGKYFLTFEFRAGCCCQSMFNRFCEGVCVRGKFETSP